MPGDYDGTMNQFKPAAGVQLSPDLQKIISQISNTIVSPGRKIAALADVGRTIGGIQQQGMQDTSSMARLGVQQTGEDKRLGISEAGATQRANITTQPSLITSTAQTTPIPGTAQILAEAKKRVTGDTPEMGVGGKKFDLDAWKEDSMQWFR